MPLLPPKKWSVAKAISEIGYTNPFLPERIELEEKALGKEFIPFSPYLQYRPECSVADMSPNSPLLRERSKHLLESMREKLVVGEPASDHELDVYEDLSLFQLYVRYMSSILNVPVGDSGSRPEDDIVDSYDDYVKDYRHFFELPGRQLPSKLDRDVIFAGLFQIERAFFHIFHYIVGGSPAAAQLRAAIWQSVFTHDMRRYMRSLYRYMGDVTTLITGPSGTGKDLVARAIAFSRFVEFDSSKRRFLTDYTESFVGLNLTAIAPNLIESELFGHAKGAFTDAKRDRPGYLDDAKSKRWSTVFLDEIGELDAQIQVKLLRVLQNREFQRVGDTETRRFVGKIVAATNRDLAVEMESGRFREDFYYRLCADRIETPSLQSQLQQLPEDLPNFVQFIAKSLLPELPEEVERLTREAVSWINDNLGSDYAWPGNIRELEQCVRSIMIRGHYSPTRRRFAVENSPLRKFVVSMERGELARDELLRGYFSLVYSKCGSYRATGKQLGVDWRTVKELVDHHLARQFDGGG